MFVRKNRNRNGSHSVQVVSKDRGMYRVVKTFGSTSNPEVLEQLLVAARNFIHNPSGQQPLFSVRSAEDVVVEQFVSDLSNANIRTVGPELIFGTLFDRIGFNAVEDDLFRHLVIARLAFPLSKLKTADYLHRHRGITVTPDSLYKFLDRLHTRHQETVERIAYQHTKKTLKTVSVVFYDMTTLYFEAEDEDDFRKIGYSKDGKFDCPQIMLGLLVGAGGYPIGYDVFEGNTFEGHTFLPTLTAIQEKYGFAKPIVVADAGLLSKQNIKELQENGYTFILGARIKDETDERKAEILEHAHGMQNGDAFSLTKEDGTRLIVTYSDTRARKDAYNREKGLRKLRKKVERGTLTKAHVNNRGYNRFLVLEGTMTAVIDETREEADKAWDGLKGVRHQHASWPQEGSRALQSFVADRAGVPYLKDRPQDSPGVPLQETTYRSTHLHCIRCLYDMERVGAAAQESERGYECEASGRADAEYVCVGIYTSTHKTKTMQNATNG